MGYGVSVIRVICGYFQLLHERTGITNKKKKKKKKKKRQNIPVTGLEWSRGFQEVKVPRFYDNGTRWW